jgi:Holliday junction resolvase
MRAAKIDRNQPEIVEALRKAGCTVTLLHKVGAGCPDLLVGRGGINYLIEVKDGQLPPSARKLNDLQVKYHGIWRGQVAVAKSVQEAFDIVGLFPR